MNDEVYHAKVLDLKEIVKEYLVSRKYDGLYHESGECACLLEDLMHCGEYDMQQCKPGYKSGSAEIRQKRDEKSSKEVSFLIKISSDDDQVQRVSFDGVEIAYFPSLGRFSVEVTRKI